MSGKTDPQIVRDYLVALGIPETDGLVEAVLRSVEGHLAAAAAEGELAGRRHRLPWHGRGAAPAGVRPAGRLDPPDRQHRAQRPGQGGRLRPRPVA